MLKRLMNPSATRLSGQNNRLNIPHLKISTNSRRVRFTFEYKFCKTPFLFQPIGETQHTPSTLTDPTAPSTSVRHRCEIVHIVRSLAFHAWWGYLVAWSGEGGGVGGQLACETDTLCFSNSQPHSPPPLPSLQPEYKVLVCQQCVDKRRVLAVVCACLATILSDYMLRWLEGCGGLGTTCVISSWWFRALRNLNKSLFCVFGTSSCPPPLVV